MIFIPSKIYSQVDSREFMEKGYAASGSGSGSNWEGIFVGIFFVLAWGGGCLLGQKIFGNLSFLFWFFLGPVIMVYIMANF